MNQYREMNYHNCEKPATDIDFNEVGFNHSSFVMPQKLSNRQYANSANFFPEFSKNMCSYIPKRHREHQQFSHKRFSKEDIFFRRPRSPYNWNLPLQNEPHRSRCYSTKEMRPSYAFPHSTKGMRPSFTFPHNFRGEVNDCQNSQTNSNEAAIPQFSNKSDFQRNHPCMQNTLYRNSNTTKNQNFIKSNVPPAIWDNDSHQQSSSQSFSQNLPISTSQFHDSSSVVDVCDKIIYTPFTEAEIPNITRTQHCSSPAESSVSITHPYHETVDADNSFKLVTVNEQSSPSFANIQRQNTTEEVPIELENALNSMDETALSTYFLNNLYSNLQVKDTGLEQDSSPQHASSGSNCENLLEEATFKSLQNKDLDQIPNDRNLNELVNKCKESIILNNADLIENLEVNTEKGNREMSFVECLDQDNLPDLIEDILNSSSEKAYENCSESKLDNDKAHILPRSSENEHDLKSFKDESFTTNLDMNATVENKDLQYIGCTDNGSHEANLESSQLSSGNANVNSGNILRINTNMHPSTEDVTNNSEKIESSFKQNNYFPEKYNKESEDQKFIFHAPVININQQNKISSQVGLNNREIVDNLKLDAFSSEFYQYLGNNIMKLLCSVTDISSAEQIIFNSSELKCALQDSLPTEKNCSFNSDEKDNNHMPNSEGSKSKTEDNEFSYVCPNGLDPEISPNHIEISKNAVENCTLDEHTDTEQRDSAVGFKTSAAVEVNPGFELNCLERKGKRRKKSKKKSKLENLNSATGNKESNFVCSSPLDSETFFHPIETSFSSETDYAFDAHLDIKHNDNAFEFNSFKCAPSFEVSSGKKPECLKQKRGRKRRKTLKDANDSMDANPIMERSESDFPFSNILDSDISLNHFETSLSSVTNYILDEPTDLKHYNETFELDNLKWPPMVEVKHGKKSEFPRKKPLQQKRKLKKNYCQLTFDPFLTPANASNSSLNLLEDIFNSNSSIYLPEFEMNKGQDYSKKGRKKIIRKKAKSGIKSHIKPPLSIHNASNLYSNELKYDVDEGMKINALNQCIKELNSSKLERHDAYSQTSEIEINPIAVKRDAQTQWNMSDINLLETFVKFDLQDKNDKTLHSPNSRQRRFIRVIKRENNEDFKHENKHRWNLRTRQLTTSHNESRRFGVTCTKQMHDAVEAKTTSQYKMILREKVNKNVSRNLPNNTKISDNTGNRSCKAKMETIFKKKRLENENILNIGKNNIRKCKKLPNNLPCRNQRKHTLKCENALSWMRTNKSICSALTSNKRKAKASNPRGKNKKYDLRRKKLERS